MTLPDWLAGVRQLRFPADLRITSLETGDDAGAWVEALEALAAETDAAGGLDPDFARRIGTLTWRVGTRAERLPDGDDSDWLRRRVDLMRRTLRTQGLEIHDYAGKPYDANEIWDDVLGSEGSKASPVIVSMQKPRLLLNGTIIQRGIPVVDDRDEPASTESNR